MQFITIKVSEAIPLLKYALEIEQFWYCSRTSSTVLDLFHISVLEHESHLFWNWDYNTPIFATGQR